MLPGPPHLILVCLAGLPYQPMLGLETLAKSSIWRPSVIQMGFQFWLCYLLSVPVQVRPLLLGL